MKIYKIVNDENDLVYFGSTKLKLSQRISIHKTMAKRYEQGKSNKFCSSYEILKYKNPQIILVEETDCENREQLRARERYYIENCDCVNKRIPGRTQKENFAKWYSENREHRRNYQKKYYRERKINEKNEIDPQKNND